MLLICWSLRVAVRAALVIQTLSECRSLLKHEMGTGTSQNLKFVSSQKHVVERNVSSEVAGDNVSWWWSVVWPP